jgi:hypothetical protein
MAQYNWSTGETTQSIVIPVNGDVNVTLTCIDSEGFVWQRCPNPVYSWTAVPSPSPLTLTLLTDDSLCTNQPLEVGFTLAPGTFAQVLSDGFPGLENNNTIILYHYIQYTNFVSLLVRNLSNYCPTYSDTINVVFTDPVNLVQVPIVNQNYIYVGESVPNVQWYLNNQLIPGATTDSLFMDAQGCYTYKAWNLDQDCAVLSSEYCNTITNSKNENTNPIELYPNPNYGVFTIVAKDDFIHQNKIFITDVTGRNLNYQLLQLNKNSAQLKLETGVAGIYFLRVNNTIKKLVVE